MAISVLSEGSGNGTWSTNKYQCSVTVASGTDVLVFAMVLGRAASGTVDGSPTSIDLGGSALTISGDSYQTPSTNRAAAVSVSYIVSPTTGAGTVTYYPTYDSSSYNLARFYYWCLSGVDTSAAVGGTAVSTATDVNSSQTLTTTVSNSFVAAAGVVASNSAPSTASLSWSANLTEEEEYDANYFSSSFASDIFPTAAGNTVTLSETDGTNCYFVAVELVPPAGEAHNPTATVNATGAASSASASVSKKVSASASPSATVSADATVRDFVVAGVAAQSSNSGAVRMAYAGISTLPTYGTGGGGISVARKVSSSSSPEAVVSAFADTNSSTETPSVYGFGQGNGAPEGCYVDLSSSGAIRSLSEPTWGFRIEDFVADSVPTDVFEAAANKTSIKAAIAAANANGGGIVRIAAGTIDWPAVDSGVRYWQNWPYSLPPYHYASIALPLGEVLVGSNTIIEGAGIGQTVINFSGSAIHQSVFGVWDSTNVVFRDLTINCDDTNATPPTKAAYGIAVYCSENVLIERVHVLRAWSISFQVKYSQNVTIRYCISDYARLHGIGNKDATERWCGMNCEEASTSQFGLETTTYGVERTTGFSMYSNIARNGYKPTGAMGIDVHSQYTEICGNDIYNNTYGGKCFDSSYLKFHHNYVHDNTGWGFALGVSNKCSLYEPHWVWFTKNRFANTGPLAVYAGYVAINAHPTSCAQSNPLRDPVPANGEPYFHDVIVNDNTYTGNSTFRPAETLGWLPKDELRIPAGATETSLISTYWYTVATDPSETDLFEDECGATSTPAVASFTRSVTSGDSPLSVSFTDTSTSDSPIESWKWEHSLDGGAWVQFSTAQNPTQVFVTGGTYSVRLTITTADGRSSHTASVFVNSSSVGGDEILLNPSFDSGAQNWSFYTNGSASYQATGGDMVLSVTNGATNTQLYQYNVSVQSETSYTLEFVAYANEDIDLPVELHQHGAPYANLGLSKSFPLTTSPQTFRTTFRATATEANARLRFVLLGLIGKTITIESVSLVDALEVSSTVSASLSVGTATATVVTALSAAVSPGFSYFARASSSRNLSSTANTVSTASGRAVPVGSVPLDATVAASVIHFANLSVFRDSTFDSLPVEFNTSALSGGVSISRLNYLTVLSRSRRLSLADREFYLTLEGDRDV